MQRRTFLQWATHGLGALFGAILGVPAIAYLIDARNRPAAAGDFKPVARLNDLQIGVPRQEVIRDLRRDAWTLHPDDVIGRVFLIRRDDKEVAAFTTICPHLGCSINLDDKRFVCPCHGGTFNLSGQRVDDQELGHANPAPRGMDSLEVEYGEDPASKDVMIKVKYQNFIQGIPEKELKK